MHTHQSPKESKMLQCSLDFSHESDISLSKASDISLSKASDISLSKARTVSIRPEYDDFKADISEAVHAGPCDSECAFVSSPAGLLLSASIPQKRKRDELPTKKKVSKKIKKKKRKKTLFSSRKKSRPDMIEKFWFVGSDDQEDWLEVKWAGSDMLTKQLAHNLPPVYQPLVAKAKAKGSEQNVSWTSCAGNGETVHPLILTGFCGEVALLGEPPQLEILHQHKTKWCHLFSLLNVMCVSKRKMRKVRKVLTTGCLGDFSDIANKAAGLIGVSLKREEGDVNFVLRQEKGKWLLLKGVHCISVDCARKFIFDSCRTQTLHMTRENLKLCGFDDKIEDLRLVR
jgi:hypothetical protein